MSADSEQQIDTVLMTTDTVGGVWTYSIELAAELAKRQVRTVLAAMGGKASDTQRDEAALVPGLQFEESEYCLEWMQDPWEHVAKAGEWLLDLQDRYRPSVIHLNNFAHGDLPWKAPVLMAGHSCVLSWWEAVHGERAPREWDYYASRVASGLAAANIVVTPTRTMLTALEKHYGPLPDSRVIHNAAAPAAFRPGTKQPFIFAAGRLWDKAKNISMLARVAGKVAWPVRVAGDGSGEPHSGLTMLGRLSRAQVAAEMASASIYAFPVRYEPFGLSILEAALAGCALVLGDISSVRENWHGCALFVDPGSEDDLRHALNLLIEDDGYRHRLAAVARTRALQFSPSIMASQYLDAYQHILTRDVVASCA
ncbi:MAG: glycosyltransferase family 4 protein [Acidobacteriaceae bacterium]|nr:glycosyltransferase family 4 protein [Acidobacteriaceae bacterium]